MSVPKKCDAKDSLFLSRNKSRCSVRLTIRADEGDRLETTPETQLESTPTFVEDFLMEHSSGLQVASIEMAGSF